MSLTIASTRVRIKGTKIYVNPRTMTARANPALYDASSVQPRLSNWTYSGVGPNGVAQGSLDLMRGRARDMARKNGIADAGLEILVDHIVGTGIRPQFTTKVQSFNEDLADLWNRWTDEADADGQYDFYGQQALAVRSMLEAGDLFCRFRPRRPGDVKTVPLQLQLLESEFCPIELTRDGILQGIEFDGIGRRTAYWMYKQHPGDFSLRFQGVSIPAPIPASEIIHLANLKRPGAIRGEVRLSRALLKLYDIDQYDDAQVVRQKIAAMFAGFMTPPAEGTFASQDDDDDADGVALAPLAPGTMQVLDPGSSISFNAPPSPGDSYDVFMRNQNRQIASSIGVLYEQLTGDYAQVNDRTWRAAMDKFKRMLERIQHSTVVFQYCRPIMERWANTAFIAGLIKLPSGVTIDDVMAPDWIPQALPYINPVQDIQARREEIRSGLRSRADVISERGDDIHKIDQQISEDNARADEMGLVFDSDPRVTNLRGMTQTAINDPNAQPEPADPNAPPSQNAQFTAMLETFGKSMLAMAEAMKPQPVNIQMPNVDLKVNIPDIISRVEIPEQKASIVNIAPANITVKVPPQPKPRKVVREVSAYDDKGRIKSMTEREIE